jgi:hypothetical protein
LAYCLRKEGKVQQDGMAKGMIFKMNFTEYEINKGTGGKLQVVENNASIKTLTSSRREGIRDGIAHA